MTKPPCKLPDGSECPERYIGCRASCQRYHEYLIIHAIEKSNMQKEAKKNGEYIAFMHDQKRRRINESNARSDKKRKNSLL